MRHYTRSVWEAVLEYRGNTELPPEAAPNSRIEWITQQLAQHADNPLELKAYDIEVGLPRYPKPSWNGTIPLSPLLTTAGARLVDRADPLGLLERTRNVLRETEHPAGELDCLNDLLSTVERRIRRTKPVVFVSYPKDAREHAQLVMDHLKDTFEPVDYFKTAGEVILDEVVKRILASDYFLAIWHHDERMPMSNGKYNISPWMPFEYGVALAAGKKYHVVHSKHLHELVWQRINPAVGSPEYSDLNFQSDTLKAIVKYCTEHWIQKDTSID